MLVCLAHAVRLAGLNLAEHKCNSEGGREGSAEGSCCSEAARSSSCSRWRADFSLIWQVEMPCPTFERFVKSARSERSVDSNFFGVYRGLRSS